MRRLLVGLTLVGLLGAGAMAQGTQDGPPPPSPQVQPAPSGPGGRHGGPMKQLGLSDQQRQQVLSIMQAHRQKMQALNQETETQLKQVMTPEQFAKFQQMRQRRPAFTHQGGPNGQNAPGRQNPPGAPGGND